MGEYNKSTASLELSTKLITKVSKSSKFIGNQREREWTKKQQREEGKIITYSLASISSVDMPGRLEGQIQTEEGNGEDRLGLLFFFFFFLPGIIYQITASKPKLILRTCYRDYPGSADNPNTNRVHGPSLLSMCCWILFGGYWATP